MTEQDRPPDLSSPSTVGDERTMLDGWLEFHRRTLEWKCEGLTPEQLRSRSVPPSNLSLIGLVRHMTDVERGWFAEHFGMDDAPIYSTEDNPDADFGDVEHADPDSDLATFRREAALYRETAKQFDLDHITISVDAGEQFNLRWIYTHMIEEYARHNGHADLLREAIDGATGS